METRLASVQDAQLLAALHGESFGAARWNIAQIAASLALATTYALIAEERGVVQGFILCQIVGEEAEILTFCVAPFMRRKNIGKILLEAAITDIQKKNAKRMFLEVAADNNAALALYKKTGFHSIGERSFYYKRGDKSIDAVMLQLMLV